MNTRLAHTLKRILYAQIKIYCKCKNLFILKLARVEIALSYSKYKLIRVCESYSEFGACGCEQILYNKYMLMYAFGNSLYYIMHTIIIIIRSIS